jgi:hypothetical protein
MMIADERTIEMPKEESTLQTPLPGVPTIDVFCTDEIKGGQDRAFHFGGGLANYKEHGDQSWFRPLLGGNSPTSSGLILKMNMYYMR